MQRIDTDIVKQKKEKKKGLLTHSDSHRIYFYMHCW